MCACVCVCVCVCHMQGARETVAKALALECLRGAHRQRRACFLYAFSGPSECDTHTHRHTHTHIHIHAHVPGVPAHMSCTVICHLCLYPYVYKDSMSTFSSYPCTTKIQEVRAQGSIESRLCYISCACTHGNLCDHAHIVPCVCMCVCVCVHVQTRFKSSNSK